MGTSNIAKPSSAGYHPNQGTVVGKERCPECAKKGKDTRGDNLVRYDDGHAWCFGCGYRVPSTAQQMLENAMGAIRKTADMMKPEDVRYSDPNVPMSEPKGLALPENSKTINVKALTWLAKYGIMREEIIKHDIRWSEFVQRLFFPIRGAGGELLAYVARSFGPNDHVKWRTYGKTTHLVHLIYPEPVVINDLNSPIVVVEDIVSAIKVGRHECCIPLFGSHVGPDKMLKLRAMTKKVIFWLDSDKYVDAMSASKRAQMLGLETHVLYSEKDPKEYTDEEIRNFVRI